MCAQHSYAPPSAGPMVSQSTDFRCERTRRLPLRTDTTKTVCSAKGGIIRLGQFQDSKSFLSVRQSTKRGRTCIEVQMQDGSSYLLTADTDTDVDDWIATLNKVVQNNDNNNLQSPKAKGQIEKNVFFIQGQSASQKILYNPFIIMFYQHFRSKSLIYS